MVSIKVETYGDYSKCPKCEKNIKSTFIIRHIKLHDQPSLSMKCPYQDCATSFTRSVQYSIVQYSIVQYSIVQCPYQDCATSFTRSAALLKVSRRFR